MKRISRQEQISYYRDKMNSYPDIRCGEWKSPTGKKGRVWVVEKCKRVETCRINTPRGRELIKLKTECDKIKRILMRLESEWVEDYGQPCESIPVRRYKDTYNSRLFESLEVGKNPFKKQNKVEYGGVVFRSKLEADFAKTMDDYGIPYKYEPEIVVYTGKHRYPDFIIYLPWLDLLILVEIFGKCEDPDYIITIRDRQYDYMMSGWKPGLNMLSYYYYDQDPYVPEMIIEELDEVVMRNLLMMKYA